MIQLMTWNANSATTIIPEEIQLSAVFGSPERRCAGSGLCRLLPRSAARHWSANCPIGAAIMIWSPTGYFQLIVANDNPALDQIRAGWAPGTIFLESPFIFPRWLCKRLRIQQAIVGPGYYPFTDQNGKSAMYLRAKVQANSQFM